MARPYNITKIEIAYASTQNTLNQYIDLAKKSRHPEAASKQMFATGLSVVLSEIMTMLRTYHQDAINDYDNQSNIDQLRAEIESLRRQNERYRNRLRNAGLPINEIESLLTNK